MTRYFGVIYMMFSTRSGLVLLSGDGCMVVLLPQGILFSLMDRILLNANFNGVLDREIVFLLFFSI